MLTIALSLLVGLAVGAGGTAAFDLVSGLVLGPIAAVVTFFLLSRRIRARVEAPMKEVEGHIKAQRMDKAIGTLESLRPLAKWQILLGPSLDAQIGMLKYAYAREFDAAEPYLARAPKRAWHPWAMRAAHLFRKKQYDEMVRVFETATKSNKKEPPLWAAYAWCEWKRGREQQAVAILARAVENNPSDERLKTQLHALQNGKKLKMHSFSPEWDALHLEKTTPPPPQGGRPGGFRPPIQAYGRGARIRHR